MAVDFSTRRTVISARTAVAACVVIVVMALGAIVAVWWPSSPSAEMPVAQDVTSVGSTSSASAEQSAPMTTATSVVETSGPLIVSVVGLVVRPGVVEVPAGARVVEAVDRAGGLLPEANPASVNLAAPLVDGQQIVVGIDPLPAPDMAGGASVAGGAGGASADSGNGGGAGASVDAAGGKININTASATELEELPGIGPATAKKIIDFREKNGPFASIDALEEVPGIGPAKVEALRDAAAV